jgi:hypothetical protein
VYLHKETKRFKGFLTDGLINHCKSGTSNLWYNKLFHLKNEDMSYQPMLVKTRSKHTQHFVKGLFQEIGTIEVMHMFKLRAIKSFLRGLYSIQEEAKRAKLDLGIPAIYFDVDQKPESKDFVTREKESVEAITQSSRKKRQKKSSKKDDGVSGASKKEFSLTDGELKLNWKTIKYVKVSTRSDHQKYKKCSDAFKNKDHYVGMSQVGGKKTYFVVSD